MKPTLAIDFDQTLCDSTFPELGPIKPGARDALKAFREMGYRILIWSCRTSHWHYDVFGGTPGEPTRVRERVRQMLAWLDENDVPYDELDDGSRGKPYAAAYIDDKAVRFEDNWEEIKQWIAYHRPL